MPTQIINDDRPTHCIDYDHNPPTMIVIPYGKKLVHTCPACGKVTTIYSNQVTL